jgi:hypothetical protein
MRADLTSHQLALADYMSALSEEAYCAGWMDGLEYALWDALLGTRHTYGRVEITDRHRAELGRLSEACGGWIVFDDVSEETWVPRAEWEAGFARSPRVGGG